ncbi:uncharacterized protein LOC130820177 isoform X1 [Amaranthus tricolor]|uniref:uncharacterized protein LOC130820177 isoform X1 n=1 Tax=Amaranthus tricolor TaxID=29722 RepID=UPI00258EEA5A|nr:uncharacterized protein LOC130820177 isoform X1 [Amaranthus tricolor]XP_057541429.1 uncharacterized protein LOC130820177 isoform X1 [Amaranthus tricolor]XP_057541430.1 uncharacterized protein LOC130820177 isoform X1 [Amaranthus tricolor]
MPSKGKSPEVDTPVPSALKEICSLDSGGTVEKFVPAIEFCKTNLQYIKNLKEVELMVLDYAMCKETINPGDVLTMHNQGEIGTNVIDCWALYLNDVEHIQ